MAAFLLLYDWGNAPLPSGAYPSPFSGSMQSTAAYLMTTPGEKWAFIWGNRCTEAPPVGPRDCGTNNLNPPDVTVTGYGTLRFRFSDTRHADGCTIAQAWQALGEPTAAQNTAILANDYPLPAGTDLAAYLAAHGGTFLDACYLMGDSFASVPDLTGLAVDFEVNDNRSTDRTDMLAGAITALAHGYGLQSFLYTLRLTSDTAAASGITSGNGPFLADTLDRITMVYDPTLFTTGPAIASDFNAQLAIIGNRTDKAVMSVPMNGISCAEVNWVRNWMLASSVTMAEAWANGANTTYPGGQYFMTAGQLQNGC